MRISRPLEQTLLKVDPTIVSNLRNRQETSIDFIDFKFSDGKVIFTGMPSNKVSLEPYSDLSRQVIRFPSFLKKTLNLGEDRVRNFTEQVVGHIVTDFDFSIEVVEGEDIRWCYLFTHCVSSSSGSNLRSCMSHKNTQIDLDFYVYNNETIKLAVVKNNGLVAARALIFHAKEGVKGKELMPFLGRIYSSGQRATSALQLWGKDNCVAQLVGGSSADGKYKNLCVPIEHTTLNYYPYMDHFHYIHPDVKLLTNGALGGPRISCGNPPSFSWPRPIITDPFRPNKVFIIPERKWIMEKRALFVNNAWYRKSQMAECFVCKEILYSKQASNLHHSGKRMCRNHNIAYFNNQMYLADELNNCIYCYRTSLPIDGKKVKDFMCDTCFKNKVECTGCKGYTLPSHVLRYYKTGVYACPKCRNNPEIVVSRCPKCLYHGLILKDNCPVCPKKITGEKAEKDTYIEISKNALRMKI